MILGRMRYTRFELGFTRNKKVNALSDAAFRLWVSLIDYAREQLTDGEITPLDLNVIPHCPSDSKIRSELINQLTQNGLLDSKLIDGWKIHDFLDWQDSAEYVKERRDSAKKRMKLARGPIIRKDLCSQKVFPENLLSLSLDHNLGDQNLDLNQKPEDTTSKPREAENPVVRTIDEEIRIVFDFWAKEMNHPGAKLGSDRKRRIKQRLDEGFTVRDLCLAIKGAKMDDWYMGKANNSNKSYDGIHNILQNTERVERFIEMSGKKRTAGGKIIQQNEQEALKLKQEHEAAVQRDLERQRKKLHGTVAAHGTITNINEMNAALKGIL